MGLPEILINFKTSGLTAIERSSRGIVALILKDSTDVTFDVKEYTSIDEIVEADYTAANYDYILKTFLGIPSRVIVYRIASDAANYTAALAALANKKWNYLAIPGIETADVATISTWIKGKRDTDHKTFKAVLPSSVSDHEGIINFTGTGIVVGATTYTTAQYCARIAGILAGLALDRSATYYELSEVDDITETATPDTDIDAGKLILVKKTGGTVRIGRAVNSLTTTTATKGAAFKKIKIIEGVDMVRDDIHDTFDESYVGKVINSYDNKILFLAAVNAYFTELERIDVLDPSMDNKAEIDTEAQRTYLQAAGVDVTKLSDQQVKEYNTGSKVFALATAKFLDAMEDLTFTIYM
ncbi:MAG: phage tail sheath protein [Syntrophomonadaceae bacterium]|nr:phage tail sheath protein [Syntrophomonadaceae bacterium]